MALIESAQREQCAVVFVHGILGFERIRLFARLFAIELHNFRGLRAGLKDLELPLYFPALLRVGTIEQRAAALARHLSNINTEHIYIIAHSMGGLDCRLLIHKLDRDRRIRCLVTVGTPHRGTPLAQWMLETKGVVQWTSKRIATPGLYDLTPAACERFNQQVPDRMDVRYLSYAGYRPIGEMPPWYRPWTRLLEREAGQNDSQVPVESARWGEFKGTVRADHLELLGWSLGLSKKHTHRPFDHVAFYRDVINSVLWPLTS